MKAPRGLGQSDHANASQVPRLVPRARVETTRRAVLQQLLVSKFGARSDEAQERIARAPERELTSRTTRSLSATSLEQVFAD